MKGFLKKILIGAMVCALCLTSVACGGQPAPAAEIDIWTATGAEKIMRDTDYSSRHGDSVLQIAVFRNEYEAGQIIITPKEDVKAYTLEMSDLSLETDTSVKLSKDNFAAYNQKYVSVERLRKILP